MRQPLQQSTVQTAQGKPIPAPIGGWNARDPIADMSPQDAVFLDNWFPTASNIQTRFGCALHATLPPDVEPASPHNVKSLLSYSAPDGDKRLFAGVEDGIYDVTAGGSSLVPSSAATNGEWISVNMTTAGGSFLWCCNGVDKSRYWDGTAWTVLDAVSIPALTGVDSEDIAHVNIHKFRLIFAIKDYQGFGFLDVNSIAGAVSLFPLGALFKKGGYTVATGTWTLDGGNGPDDYFAAITSEGQIAIYSGTDPGDASAWSLVGVYEVGEPIGRNCFVKVAGDLCIITVQGLFPLSKVLQLAQTDKRVDISDKIAKAWTDSTALYKDLYGWQAVFFPQGPFVLVNVPVLDDTRYDQGLVSYQYVMNTQTKAWCRFVGWNPQAWCVHDGKLWFGRHNRVFQAWTGTNDNGAGIDCRAKAAYWYPYRNGDGALCTLFRPTVSGPATLNFQYGIDVDFTDRFEFGGSQYNAVQNIALWDEAIWDESYWFSGSLVSKQWKTASHHPGKALSFRLRINARDVTMQWTATDFVTQRCGLVT